jgi:hypothetical protein
MQGYRTYVVAAAGLVVWALARFGFEVDANVLADAMGAVFLVMMGMRKITSTPPGEKE